MRKKYIFLLLVSLAITFTYCSKLEKNQYRLYGKIEGMANGTANIVIPDDTAKRGVRYVEIQFQDGAFEYVGTAEGPEVIRMWINDDRVKKMVGKRSYIPVKCGLFWFIAAPGKEIKVSGDIKDFVNAYPSDGAENDVFSIFMKEAFPVINESGNLMIENVTNKNLTDEEKQAIESKLEKLGEKEQAIRMNFLKKQTSSVAALWLMEDMLIRSQIKMEEVEEFIKEVDPKYAAVSYYKALQSRLDGFRATEIGKIAPDIITHNTPDGSEFNLESLRGKYVILDFWGTWCGACIAGTPAMKKFRDEHQDKIQILGIAKDSDVALWKKFIIEHEMNWPHVLVGKGDENFVEKFNVAGYPTKILLDPEGKIVLRSVGESEEFYNEVEQLLK